MFGASGGERTGQTAEEYTAGSFLELLTTPKGIASARKAVVGLRREINANDIRVNSKCRVPGCSPPTATSP
jgi:hypothetical protein